MRTYKNYNLESVKQNGMVNFENIKSSGNYTMDMIMSCIAFYRKKYRPINTIYLNAYHWNELYNWVRTKDGDIDIEKFELEFDGVKLKYQTIKTNNEIDVTFYPNATDISNKIPDVKPKEDLEAFR